MNRRDFLKSAAIGTTAIGVLGAALPQTQAATPDTVFKMMQVKDGRDPHIWMTRNYTHLEPNVLNSLNNATPGIVTVTGIDPLARSMVAVAVADKLVAVRGVLKVFVYDSHYHEHYFQKYHLVGGCRAVIQTAWENNWENYQGDDPGGSYKRCNKWYRELHAWAVDQDMTFVVSLPRRYQALHLAFWEDQMRTVSMGPAAHRFISQMIFATMALDDGNVACRLVKNRWSPHLDDEIYTLAPTPNGMLVDC